MYRIPRLIFLIPGTLVFPASLPSRSAIPFPVLESLSSSLGSWSLMGDTSPAAIGLALALMTEKWELVLVLSLSSKHWHRTLCATAVVRLDVRRSS